MEVIDYIRENSLEALKKNFYITSKHYLAEDRPETCRIWNFPNLHVLNYTDRSPNDPIANACRSLIIDDDCNVVSRSFDRFPESNSVEDYINYKSPLFRTDKLDGSLIKAYNVKNVWFLSTRRTAFAEGPLVSVEDDFTTSSTTTTEAEYSFRQLFLDVLKVSDDDFQKLFNDSGLDPVCTYIFEIVSPFNRHVIKYSESKIYLLAIRNNITGDYTCWDDFPNLPNVESIIYTTVHFPSLLQDSMNLNSNDPSEICEGYVLYKRDFVPIFKFKTNMYKKYCPFATNNVDTRRKKIMELVLTCTNESELDKLVTVFPTFESTVERIKSEWEYLKNEMIQEYESLKNIKDNDLYMAKLNNYVWMAAAKNAKQNRFSILKAFNRLGIQKKISILKSYIYSKLTLKICVGISKSGKSLYAARLTINDDYYEISKNDENKKKNWQLCVKLMKNVIISDTNLESSEREYWHYLGKTAGYTVVEIPFDIDLDEAQRRNRLAGRFSIDPSIINDQYKLYLDYRRSKHTFPPVYQHNFTLEAVILCDVDGTILEKDGITPRMEVINMLAGSCGHFVNRVVFMTTQNENNRNKVTNQLTSILPRFLQPNENGYECLLMSANGDTRDEASLKMDMYTTFIKPSYRISMVIEDRPRLVRMWKDLGLPFVVHVQKDYNEF